MCAGEGTGALGPEKRVLTSSQALAHSPAEPPSQVSRALSIAVSMADLSVVCTSTQGKEG